MCFNECHSLLSSKFQANNMSHILSVESQKSSVRPTVVTLLLLTNKTTADQQHRCEQTVDEPMPNDVARSNQEYASSDG